MLLYLCIIGGLNALSLPEVKCNTTAQGITSKQTSQIEQLLNTIRNDVATGKRANHIGQIQSASNMHIVQWSNKIAKQAQECSENCPTAPIYCRNAKGQDYYLIHLQIVHNIKYEFNPLLIFDEWMSMQKTSQQLLQALLFQIGCGRALTQKLDKYLVYTICFFDYPNKPDPYQPTSQLHIGNACRLGQSSKYIGLCLQPYSKEYTFISKQNLQLKFNLTTQNFQIMQSQ